VEPIPNKGALNPVLRTEYQKKSAPFWFKRHENSADLQHQNWGKIVIKGHNLRIIERISNVFLLQTSFGSNTKLLYSKKIDFVATCVEVSEWIYSNLMAPSF
jgi:hypothetical protein